MNSHLLNLKWYFWLKFASDVLFSDIGEVKEGDLTNSEANSRLWTKLWMGKDYTNFIVKDFSQLDKPMIGIFQFLSPSSPNWTERTEADENDFRFFRSHIDTEDAVARHRPMCHRKCSPRRRQTFHSAMECSQSTIHQWKNDQCYNVSNVSRRLKKRNLISIIPFWFQNLTITVSDLCAISITRKLLNEPTVRLLIFNKETVST